MSNNQATTYKAGAAVPLLAPLRQLLSCGAKFCTAAHRRAAMPPPPAAAPRPRTRTRRASTASRRNPYAARRNSSSIAAARAPTSLHATTTALECTNLSASSRDGARKCPSERANRLLRTPRTCLHTQSATNAPAPPGAAGRRAGTCAWSSPPRPRTCCSATGPRGPPCHTPHSRAHSASTCHRAIAASQRRAIQVPRTCPPLVLSQVLPEHRPMGLVAGNAGDLSPPDREPQRTPQGISTGLAVSCSNIRPFIYIF